MQPTFAYHVFFVCIGTEVSHEIISFFSFTHTQGVILAEYFVELVDYVLYDFLFHMWYFWVVSKLWCIVFHLLFYLQHICRRHWAWRPILLAYLTIATKNSSAACSVPYRAFLSLMYSMGLPFLFFHINFLYRLGSSLTISLTKVPSRSMWTACSMPMCKNAPSMFVTATYVFSLASFPNYIIIASRDMVGVLVSSLLVYWLRIFMCTPPGFYCAITFFF